MDEVSRLAHDPPVVRHGHGAARTLAAEVEAAGADRALVVTGRSVGASRAVMAPVREGLGDRLAGVFAETTPEKTLATARAAVDAMRETGADALVGLGGGSSLDVATVASALAATDREEAAVERAVRETGALSVPEGPLAPVLAVPTTLAGAAASTAAGLTVGGGGDRVAAHVADPRLMPAAAVYDPALVATTPDAVLRASAMNGFDKALETLYARDASPVTDATATAALGLLVDALPTLASDDRDVAGAVEGTLLAEYGISRRDGTTLSVIHAFGHGLRTVAGVHQGRAHAAVAPAALAHLFGRVDGRRRRLAAALGLEHADRSDADVAAAVVDAVAAVRDGLALPDRLRDLDGLGRDDVEAVADATVADRLLDGAPPGYELSREAARSVLREAW